MNESEVSAEHPDTEALQSSSLKKEHKSEKVAKPKRVASRFFNALLALVFLCLFIFCVVSFSSFSYVYHSLEDSSGRKCILNADGMDELGSDGSCRLGIGGEVVIAIYSLLSIAVMIVKIIGGWSIMSCFLIFELIAVVLMMLLSFCTSVVISVGLSLTCRNLSSQSTTGGGCEVYTIGSTRFFKGMQVAEATAWIGFAVLVGLTVFYVLCVIMYCYGKRKAKQAKAKEAAK